MFKKYRKEAQRLARKNATAEEWSIFYLKAARDAAHRVDGWYKGTSRA